MSNKIIPSNIKNLSQLLDDGLILCDKLGAVISSNSMAQQFINQKLNNKNISDFIDILEFKNLEESHANGNLNDEFHFQTKDILKRSGGAVVVPPEDSRLMAKEILSLCKNKDKLLNMGVSGREFVTK